MCVKRHTFALLECQPVHPEEGVGPLVVGVQDAVRCYAETLGRDPELLDVGHFDQALADKRQMLRCQVVCVTP